MKKIRNWILLIIVVIGISVALFVTGRLHNIYIENKSKDGYLPVKGVTYSLNGEKAKKIRENKRGMVEGKGRTHELTVKYKDENGDKKEIKKELKLGITEDVIINLPILINGGDNWIEEFKK